MSLVSGYSTTYNDNNNSSPVAAAAASPFYPPDYSSQSSAGASHHHHQTTFFTSSGNWSWPASNNQSAEYHPSTEIQDLHHHQQQQQHHSPPLGSYPSASPDYYGNYHQQYPAADYHHHHHHSLPATAVIPAPVRVVRVVKRRNTANKKERRRTMSINNAFSDLRDCIPNVPADTKLSKIKTLRLATSYISYLMAVLEAGPDTDIPFRAELGRQSKSDKMAAAAAAAQQQQQQQSYDTSGCFHNKEQVRNLIVNCFHRHLRIIRGRTCNLRKQNVFARYLKKTLLRGY